MAFDVLANSKAMTENAAGNFSKGWYVGYSQGTIQAMAALARFESEVAKYLERLVLLAPCFGYSTGGETKASAGGALEAAGYIIGELANIGIYATGTSTWAADKTKICAELSAELCQWAESQPADAYNPLKNDDAWKQTSEAGRYQQYVDNWSSPGNTEGTLYALEEISTVPVSMYVGSADAICDPAVAATESARFSTLQNYYAISGASHGFPASNKADFVNLLKAEFTTTTTSLPNRESITLEGTAAKEDDKSGKGGFDYEAWEKYVAENCGGDDTSKGCYEGYLEAESGSKNTGSEDGATKTLVTSLFVSIASI